MNNIIITGATSFIGCHLIQECINNKCYITAIVRPNSKNLNRMPKNDLLTIIELDMENLDQLPFILENQKFDVFYHLAWEGARFPYRDNYNIQENNYECAIKAFDSAIKLGCKTFVGTGSQAEYGKCMGVIDETYLTKPTTEYGKSKLKTYEILNNMAKDNCIKFIWSRIFSIYGVFDYKGTLVMTALDKMRRNEDILLTECKQNWDYLYVEDAARALYMLGMSECKNGVYNIANGYGRELRKFVEEMKFVANSSSSLLFGEIPYDNEGVVSFIPVVDKLKANIDWNNNILFSEGVKKILNDMNIEEK